MTWFERLTGFPECSPEQIRQQLIWILESLARALHYCANCGLDGVMVSYGRSRAEIQSFIRQLGG